MRQLALCRSCGLSSTLNDNILCRTTYVVAAWASRHTDCVDVEVQPVIDSEFASFSQLRASQCVFKVFCISLSRHWCTTRRPAPCIPLTSLWTASAIIQLHLLVLLIRVDESLSVERAADGRALRHSASGLRGRVRQIAAWTML
jgi:hypothetical protein